MNPVNIMDRNFNFLGQIDNYTSYMPSKSWYGIGDVELHIHQSARHTEHLQKENILYTSDDKAYVILHRELNSETGKMVIKGRELKSYLSRWLIYPPEGKAYFDLNAAPETIMKSYVQATLERKGVTEIVVAPDLERGTKTSYQARYKNLGDELEKLSLDSGLSWDLRLDHDAKKFVFDCYVGLDRSADQDVNANAIFSVDYDNITSQKLVDSKYGFANMALVAGQGEGEWRVVEEVGETGAGLDSYELFVDARDIEYDEYLADRGRQKLAELPEKLSFDSVVDTTKNLKYGTDFNLGDMVTIANKSWGITTDRIITEIKEIHEPSGFRLEVTFGEGLVTIQDKIKQLIDSPIAEGGGGGGDGSLSYPLGNVSDFTASVGNETVTLKWTDPSDRYIFDDVGDPVPIAVFEGTKILRKEESYPVDENDGVLVVDSKVRDQYKTTPYVDSGLTNDVEYYYMAFPYTDKRVFTVDSANRISAVPTDGDDKWTDIGSKFLVGGDMQAGYFGIVPASELITGDALATLVGISAGTSQFSNEGWLKFAYEGKILFVAKKTIRHSISWDHINAANCARGAVAQKTVKGHTFKIRLMKGSNAIGDSTIPDYGTASSGALNHGSEWNKLMLPIHANAAPGKSWADPGNVGTNDTAYWGIDFTDADLQTHYDHGNGSYSLCQETAYQTTYRLYRGFVGVSYSDHNSSSGANTGRGWRPCLELVV